MEFPQRFGKYTLLKRIATGGMADIFLAHMRSSQGFEKEVVIKRLRPEHAANPDLVGMFLDEARTAANLTHANIAQIFDLGGSADDGYFIAMEFVRGVDLRRICEQGIAENNYLPLHHAVRIMADVCDALAYAHAEVSANGTPLQVVHRDVSPTNILVSYDGAVKLIDFGIAKARTQSTLTKVGQIKGKFGYMAPEQCLGLDVDARTDIFAVGINLYEITLGQRLFRGETEVETLEKIEACEIDPPRTHNPKYPEGLERIVMRALARDPGERYQDARQMQMALEEFLVGAGLRSTAGMLAAYMRRIFREQITTETEELSDLRGLARSMPPPAVAPSTSMPPGALRSPTIPPGRAPSLGPAAVRSATLPPLGGRPAVSGPPAEVPAEAPAASAPPVEASAPPAVSTPPSAPAAEPTPAPAPASAPVAPAPAPTPAPAPAAPTPAAAAPTPAPAAVAPTPAPAPIARPTPAPAPAAAPPSAPASRPVPAGPSVLVDPSLTSPGLRAEAATPAPTGAPLMNPWSTFSTAPGRTARGRNLGHAPVTVPPEAPVDEDIRIVGPRRNYLGPLVILVLLGVGGYFLYKTMIEDARSGRERGNPNMVVAPPRLEDTVPMEGATPRPPPAKALLRIDSKPPGARVVVNGNVLSGVTPTAVQTFSGHQATVQLLLDGHLPQEKRLMVTGDEAQLSVELVAGAVPTGTIDVTASPEGAEVYLDGQPMGNAPMKLEKVPAGVRHVVRLRKPGFYDHTVLLDVEAEKEARAFVRLAPAVGERTIAAVRVETLPIGAAVASLEDGGEKGHGKTTIQDGVTLNAPMGHPLHLRATLDKHTPAVADLDVVDPNYTVYLRLAPPEVHYGKVSVTGTKGLTIYVGNEEVGNVPVKDAKVKAGDFPFVVLDEESRMRVEGTITIEKDQTATRKVTMANGKITIE